MTAWHPREPDAGKWAATMLQASLPARKPMSLGYSAVLYLDPKEKKYLDECGPANFFAIKDGKYITPASESILPSVTNDSLKQAARPRHRGGMSSHTP